MTHSSRNQVEKLGATETSRRKVLKAAAYVTPAVATMAVSPAFAVTGSRGLGNTGNGGRARGGSGGSGPVRRSGGGRGRGASGS